MKLRELLSLARERLGERATELKTREELEAALFPPGLGAAEPRAMAPRAPEGSSVVITRDFFVRRS